MLPREQRMVRGEDFRTTVRRGARAAQPSLVAHVAVAEESADSRVGFVVSKAVGHAADRNRVKRRLRHLMRDRVSTLAPGSRVVVRALPAAATTTTSDLGEQLDAALRRAASRAVAS